MRRYCTMYMYVCTIHSYSIITGVGLNYVLIPLYVHIHIINTCVSSAPTDCVHYKYNTYILIVVVRI